MDAPPAAVCRAWDLRVEAALGGGGNQTWFVSSSRGRCVLRSSADHAQLDLPYELEVLTRLTDDGWRVPRPVRDPMLVGGRWWCLFSRLPGSPGRPAETVSEQRRRGSLLAELHLQLSQYDDLGQRGDWPLAPEVVTDAELVDELRRYEATDREAGRLLRWHADRAAYRFDEIGTADLPMTVLHSDFAPWNLLWDSATVTGVLDFASAHRNLRVSDFALAWRGRDDAVVEGYRTVTELSERELELLAPALWSWVFLGVARELRTARLSHNPPPSLGWHVEMLRRRSPAMGVDST